MLHFRLSCVVALSLSGIWSGQLLAVPYTFDPSMLDGGNSMVDLSLFEEGAQMPGIYPVNIVLGEETVDRRNLAFHLQREPDGKRSLQPCLTVEQLSRYGIRTEKYPGLATGGGEEGGVQCARINAIPQGSMTFAFFRQQLIISVPQAALRPRFDGIAPESMWDDGIPALMSGYQVSVNRSQQTTGAGSHMDSAYLRLTPGANLGPWRLRNILNWQRNGQSPGRWERQQSYVERGIIRLKSRLTLGESATPSDVFDSVPFRGVMLATDEAMIPSALREFAPAVRGIARSPAQLEIRQNGYLLYSRHVAAGPFAVTDLPGMMGSGDLQVTVVESQGPTQRFTVPYTVPPVALRAGYMKYSVMAGQYRSSAETAGGDSGRSSLGLATLMYGLPSNVTLYGGMLGGERYQSASLGAGLMLSYLGAVSADITATRGRFRDGRREEGTAIRVRYNKYLEATGTGLSASSEWYPTGRYHTLSEVMDDTRGDLSPFDDDFGWTPQHFSPRDLQGRRYATTMQVSQTLGELGTIYASGSRTQWQDGEHEDTLNTGYGYSYSWRYISMNLSVNYVSTRNRREKMMALSMSVPLSHWLGRSPSANYQVRSGDGQVIHSVGISGSGYDSRLNWGLSQQMYSGGERTQDAVRGLSAGWTGGYGSVSGSYSYSRSQRYMSAELDGGMLIHRHGITLGQTPGDTTGLIEIPGVAGVSVGYMPGVQTDLFGYTTENTLAPYQINTVSLDVSTLPEDAEVGQTDVKVVPTRGAVIRAHFDPRIGARALITLTRTDGMAVPFGALVSLAGTATVESGITGDGGTVYMSGLPPSGRLTASMGTHACEALYQLPEKPGGGGVYRLKAVCRESDQKAITGGQK